MGKVSEHEARSDLVERLNVSRETLERLDSCVHLLRRWQDRINLIAPSTIDHIWVRHVLDSAQIAALAPDAETWVDLGSGGGFPGLVVAAMQMKNPRFQMHLVESNAKKCAFLREAARLCGLPVTVHPMRIEAFSGSATRPHRVDVVSARALAPLTKLLTYAEGMLLSGAKGIFMKGSEAQAELTAAAQCWRIQATMVPSLTDTDARIVLIEHLTPITHESKALHNVR
ncbi:MAG: 16S rRNA (guanine(527)-N(7))-methyltransferase RsmG [Beijerinckiaceae bacterium]